MEPLLLCAVRRGLSSPAEKVANKWRDNVDIHRPAANLGSTQITRQICCVIRIGAPTYSAPARKNPILWFSMHTAATEMDSAVISAPKFVSTIGKLSLIAVFSLKLIASLRLYIAVCSCLKISSKIPKLAN
jgi:hypothetical protein